MRVAGPGTSMPRASVVTVLDLEGEADLWVRSEATHTEVTVIRGEAKLMIGTTGLSPAPARFRSRF